ncbi:MAG TPA: hypothetical protein VLH84_02740 [Patescibacteria group bacterium]|nr:hypothetical protein [Patescibacteria group bacterium]
MKTKLISILASTVAVASLLLSGTSYAAGSAAFSLSPASGTEDINSTFAVGIYENGTSVNVVTANLSYDTSKLQLVSVDISASAFASDAGSTSTSISRYVPAGGTVSGPAEVAVVNFKAIAGSGTANVTVGTSGSHIASGGADQWNGAPTSGTYTLNTPVVTPPPATGGGSTTGTGSTTKTTTTTTSSKTTTPVVAGASTTQPAVTDTTAAITSSKTVKTTPVVIANAANVNGTSKGTTLWLLSLVLALVIASGTLYELRSRRAARIKKAAEAKKTLNKRPVKKTTAARVAKPKKVLA